MSKQSLLLGTAILMGAGLFNRILGFLYQILIIDLIGAKGIGLYNMVFPIYILALVIASAGIPLAVSKFVAAEAGRNNPAGAKRILKLALLFVITTSTLLTFILYYFLPFLKTNVIPNPQSYIVFQVLLPGILIISVCSTFRGYFQGLMQMTPTAVTHVTEQIVRVCAGLFFAGLFLPKGIPYAAMGSALGMILGELSGLLLMLYIYYHSAGKDKYPGQVYRFRDQGKLLLEMLFFSIPVTLSRIVATLILSLEASIIPKQLLLAGYTLDQATIMYGQLTGMALPILAIPSILTSSLATALVPAISEAYASHRHNLLTDRINESLRVTIYFGLPAVVIFFLFPRQLTALLFHNAQAGSVLQVLAAGGLFYYLQQTTTGILQGLGKANLPLRNLLIACLLELAGLLILVKIPGWGLLGAAWAINISFIVVAVLNLLDISKLSGLIISLQDFLVKPVLINILLGIIILSSYGQLLKLLAPNYALLSALALAAACYFILLLMLGLINTQNIRRLIKR